MSSPDLPYMPYWEWQLLDTAGNLLGSLGSATARSLSLPLNGPAVAQFTMADQHPQAAAIVELATDVLIARGTQGGPMTTVFRGRITASTDTLSADGQVLNVTATDYRGMLDHRLVWPGVTLDYPNMDPAELAWTVIQEMQNLSFYPDSGGLYDLGIRQGTGYPTGATTSKQIIVGSTVGQVINDLGSAGLYGFDWDVDVNLMFNVYYPFKGQDANISLVYGPDVTSVTFTVTPDGYANGIYMTGAHVAKDPYTGNPLHPISANGVIPPGPGAGSYGGWDQQKADPAEVVQLALDDVAGGWLNTLSQPVSGATLVLAEGRWVPEFMSVGDTVHVTVPVGRPGNQWQNLAKRISQIDVTLDDDGVEMVTLMVGPLWAPTRATEHAEPAETAPLLSKRFKTINRRLSKLELGPGDGGGTGGPSGYADVSSTPPNANSPTFSPPEGLLWVDTSSSGSGGGGVTSLNSRGYYPGPDQAGSNVNVGSYSGSPPAQSGPLYIDAGLESGYGNPGNEFGGVSDVAVAANTATNITSCQVNGGPLGAGFLFFAVVVVSGGPAQVNVWIGTSPTPPSDQSDAVVTAACMLQSSDLQTVPLMCSWGSTGGATLYLNIISTAAVTVKGNPLGSSSNGVSTIMLGLRIT